MNARANILILSDNLNPFNVGVLGSSPRRITRKSELSPQRGCVVIKVYGAASDFRALRSRYFSGDRFFWIFPKYRILKP